MEVLNFIFRLGVVFAIFGFLWGMIDIALRLLTASRQRTLIETYIIKGVKYLFLADVTFLFCLGDLDKHMIVTYQVVLAGIVLLMYFVGKLQNSQNRSAVFQMMGRNIPQMPKLTFNLKAEMIVIGAAIALFVVLGFYPWLASNAASSWFHESILSIEDAFFFGFIFKVIGFFFMLNIFFQMAGGITFLLNGGKVPTSNSGKNDPQDTENNDFDNYEEVE